MGWVVGIDEAGYGPNLGPLVQAAVVKQLPDDDPAGWSTLRTSVRRAHEPDDTRLLIDDSKKVYSGLPSFAKLERNVLASLGLAWTTFSEFLHFLGLPGTEAECGAEPWYDGTGYLEIPSATQLTPQFSAKLNLVQPARFNRIITASGSKATALSEGLIALIQASEQFLTTPDPALILCDKQGGRNFYAAIVQTAFPNGWVVAERECASESGYRIEGLSREVTVLFRPRADGDSVCVALASMVCKYLRELCMMQFNAYWQKHVPGVKATAGYPVDAKRFYAEIEAKMRELGHDASRVWRVK